MEVAQDNLSWQSMVEAFIHFPVVEVADDKDDDSHF